MANPITLETLRDTIREQTDADGDRHITDAFLTRHINRGINKYVAQISKADPNRFLVTDSLDTTQGTYEYELPADFWELRGVDYPEGDSVQTLRSFQFEERARRRALGGTEGTGFDLPRYRVARSDIDGSAAAILFDIDPGTRRYTLHYLPVPPVLVEDDDAVDDINGLSDYLVAYVSVKVRNRRDEPADLELRDKAEAERDIASQAPQRHVDGFEKPPSVRRRRHINNPLRW